MPRAVGADCVRQGRGLRMQPEVDRLRPTLDVMSTSDFDDVFTKLIAQADEAARKQREGGGGGASVDLGLTEPVVGEGTAADDRITATMTDGKLTGCEIQPHAMRMSNAELGDAICTAVNGAIQAYQQALTEALAAQQPDLSNVSGNLRNIQFEATEAMKKYNDQMYEMLRSVKERD